MSRTVNCCFCHRVRDNLCVEGSASSSASKSTRPGLLWGEKVHTNMFKHARMHRQLANHFTVRLIWTHSMQCIYDIRTCIISLIGFTLQWVCECLIRVLINLHLMPAVWPHHTLLSSLQEINNVPFIGTTYWLVFIIILLFYVLHVTSWNIPKKITY